MRTFFFGLLFVLSTKTYGQSSTLSDTLHWSENRSLGWADFKGETIDGIGFTGEVFCLIIANFERPDNSKKTKFTVFAIFDKTKSWISPEGKTNSALKYFQILFDIYEVHARHLRKELEQSETEADVNVVFQEKYNRSMTNLTTEFNIFRKETKLGKDKKILLKWKKKVEDELQSLEAYKNNSPS
ncbi:MAG: hypothetical protein LCH54_07710 [Bacteroidetes bacterium]|nr:hypothetical protein [Bacteroidota bacterium]